MVIVIFTESYYPYYCGVTEAVQNLADNLRTLGFIVYIVAPAACTGYSCGGDWVIRIPSYPTGQRNYRAAYPWFFQSLVKKIIDLKPDVLHSHGPYATHRLASIVAKKLHIPLVMTWHTLAIDYMRCWMREAKIPTPIIKLASWIVKMFIKWMCNQTNLILAPTHFVREMLRSYQIKTPIQVLPLAINLEMPKPNPEEVERLRNSLHVDPNDKILLYVGRVAPEKNINLLLEVFRRIILVRRDCHLVIVGPVDKDEVYQRLALTLGIPSDKITFAGEVPREKTLLYYQMANLFLFASTTDNSPRTILEAMMCMPVVAVRAGGVPDLVIDGQTGILVKPDDIVNGMARAALKIMNSPSLSDDMKRRAKKEVASDKYDPYKYAEEIVRIYRQLIEYRKR